jgi:hypothetical protein
MPNGEDTLVLQETDRAKLDGIVQQMVANKESDDNIQFVVSDFKTKYGKKKVQEQVTTEPLQNGGQPVSNNTPTTSTSDAEKLQQVPLVGQSFTQQNLQNNQQTVTPQQSVTTENNIQPISHDDLVNALGSLKNKSDFSPSQLEVKQKQTNDFNKLGAATSPERNNTDIQDALVKLNQNPNDDNAIYQLGYGTLATGNTEGAQSLFTQALQVNPDNYKAKMGLGTIDFKNGNYESALQSFQSAMPNIPENVTLADGKEYKNPDYQQNILQIAQNQTLLSKTKPELLPDAEKNVDYVLSQSPNDVLATQLKSQIEKQKGNIDASKELDNKAVSDYVAQSPAPTMFDLEQKWIKDHPKETRSFGQAWMDAHADLESKWGKVGADVLDPLGLVVGNVQAIGEGLKDMKEGLDKMQPKSLIESGNMTKKYFEGLTQTIKGGASATFAAGMTSPTGFAFDLATDAGDLVSNGYASKIIMSPLQSFMPKTDDALTNNLYNIGDVIINGVALGALHEGLKSPEVKKAYDKLKDGKDLKPTEVKLLNETVQENATPENLQKINDAYSKLNTKEVGSNANEVIADYINIPDEVKAQIPSNISTEKSVELAPLLEKYDAKKKELDSAHETLKEPLKLSLEKIQEQINEVIKAPNKDYELDATNKTEPIELTPTKTEDVSAQPSEEVGGKVPPNPKEETATVTEAPKEGEVVGNQPTNNVGVENQPKDFKRANELKVKIKSLRNEDGSVSDENIAEFKKLKKEYDSLELETINDVAQRIKNTFANETINSEANNKYKIPSVYRGALRESLKKDGYSDEEINYIVGDDANGRYSDIKKRFDEINEKRKSEIKPPVSENGTAPIAPETNPKLSETSVNSESSQQKVEAPIHDVPLVDEIAKNGVTTNIPFKDLNVRMSDLKIAEDNLSKGKKSVTPNEPVEVSFNLTTGKKELEEGYHRYLDARGGTIENAKKNIDGGINAKVKFTVTEKNSQGFSETRDATSKEISDAYQKAKADGSNSELVKLIEPISQKSDVPLEGEKNVGGEKPKSEQEWKTIGIKGKSERTEINGYVVDVSRRFDFLKKVVGADLTIKKKNADGSFTIKKIISDYKTFSEAKKDAINKVNEIDGKGIETLKVKKNEPNNVVLKDRYKDSPDSEFEHGFTFIGELDGKENVDQSKPFAVGYFGDTVANRYEHATASNDISDIVKRMKDYDNQEGVVEIYNPETKEKKSFTIYPDANEYTNESVGLKKSETAPKPKSEQPIKEEKNKGEKPKSIDDVEVKKTTNKMDGTNTFTFKLGDANAIVKDYGEPMGVDDIPNWAKKEHYVENLWRDKLNDKSKGNGLIVLLKILKNAKENGADIVTGKMREDRGVKLHEYYKMLGAKDIGVEGDIYIDLRTNKPIEHLEKIIESKKSAPKEEKNIPEKKVENKGKEISPNKQIKTDVETVMKELGYGEKESLIYDNLKGVSEDKRLNALDDVIDGVRGEYDAIDKEIDANDRKLEDIDHEIDDVNDDNSLTKKEKKNQVAELEKQNKELVAKNKELEDKKVDNKKLTEDLEAIYYSYDDNGHIELTDKIINAIDTRLETRRGVKEGWDLFPEEANIPELKEKVKELKEKTNERTIKKFADKTESEVEKLKPIVTNLESKGASDNKAKLKEVIAEADVLTETKANDNFYVQALDKDLNQTYLEVNGKKVDIANGLDTFIHKDGDEWRVSDGKSGTFISRSKTKSEAIRIAKDLVESKGIDAFNNAIQGHVDKYGISPRYEKTVTPKETITPDVAPKTESKTVTVTPKNETVTPPLAPKEIVEPPKKEISEGAKKIADKIRGLKTKEITFKDKDGNEIPLTKKGVGWNDIVEGIAKKVEETGDIVQAISDYLNEQDWYKGLSKEDKKAVEEQVKGNLDEEGIVTGIAHKQTDAAARRLGLPEYEKNPETFAQWDAEAQTRIENGDMPDLIKKMQDGDMPSAVEQRMMAKYAADLLAKIEKNPTNELINKYGDFKKLADEVGGREVGKSLAARKGLQPVIENVADMYVAKMEASGVEELTEAQKQYVEKIKKEYDELNAKSDALLKEAKEKIAKLEASKEFNKLKGERKATKKTHADYQKERADLIQKFKDAGKDKPDAPKQSGAPINDEQVKIVLQLAKSFVDEAVDVAKLKLGEVVDKISEAVGLDKGIIHNVLAGDYSKKQSKTELQMKMADLREEAKLTNKLAALQRGEEPKTEKARVERNQQIKELRDKIKDFRKEKDLAEQEPEIKKDPNEVALEKIISRNEKKQKELQDKIDKGDFEKKKAPSVLEDNRLKENYPDLWKKTMDALKKTEDKAHEFDIELYKDEQARRSTGKKVVDLGKDVIGTAKALKAGIDDSALLIQNIVALTAHPSVIPHVVAGHLTDLWSQKNYDRWLTNLHNSPSWDLIRNSGLDVTEPKSLSAEKKEETYDRNLLNKTFNVKGKEYSIGKYTTKPFERMFTSLSNRTRVGVFLRIAQKFYNEGMTFETHPKEFESLAKLLNTETGRGDLHPKLQKIQGLLSAGIWSPKLMSSRLALLGASDVINPVTGEKGFYKSLTPKVRAQAARDMAQFVGAGLGVMALFALQGYSVDLNPTSVTFGNVSKDGKSYNFFGGFTQYVRLAAQMMTGKQTVEGVTTPQGTEKSAMLPLHFLRGKTTPLVGSFINWKLGKDYVGHPTTLGNEALGMVTPLSMNNLVEGLKQEGVASLLTSELPALTGINVSYQSQFKREMPTEIEHNGVKEKLSDNQHEELQNLYDTKFPNYLNTLVNTQLYKNGTDEEKYNLRQTASTLALNESEKEIKKKYPQQFVKETKEQVDERFKKDLDLWKYKKSLGLKDIGNIPQRSNYKAHTVK